ncbi:MAG: gluconate 2-dehydrogenase subunit 3 family protein [Nitrospirae bacterium]|nr:gluconate 2-dehydrogenase subunit 3 family protein [Nitrospirota bacterium]
MPVSRRDFLRVAVGGGLLAVSAYLFRDLFRPTRLSLSEERTLEALLDTLIPEDVTPGALQLGVPEQVKSKAATDNRYRLLIKKGCTWLNSMARELNAEGFVYLKEEGRDAIIDKALKSGYGSMQRIFLYTMRADTLHYYYSHRGSWASLGYNGPPQPYGFPDYYQAPALRG